MDKLKCIRQKAIRYIITERILLERIHSPMIVNLRYCFQDDDTLFLALDPMEMDLRLGLEQQMTLEEVQVRHYVACIGIALDHLQSQRIVHRDIKPENILLDAANYAHLSDFNIAVQLTPEEPVAWSRSGTVAYMAPEMLAKKGYGSSVDWWSLGVVAFELLFGMRPFRADTKDELIRSISRDPLVFPSKMSLGCIDLIRGVIFF
ncbi:kinase-like domain-containing protein [Sporodiniella umbellata]|nr:kinase-like domain-containing protein [Sporodiniella umbellata]